MKQYNILVTGGAGFIGSHVADAYIAAGHRVTVIDNLSTGNRAFVNPKADFFECDINDARVATLFTKKRFDIVNHHAAQVDVRISVGDPYFDATTNIMGSINLFENARTHGCKKMIFISSGGVMYGECKTPQPETAPLQPISPYGISKLTVERYLAFYAATYHIPYTILRYGNVYGPRQNPKGEAGVVAIFSDRMLANDTVLIFGTGYQKRDYVYVKDIAAYNLAALDNGANQIVNIGTGICTSVNALFKSMAHCYDYAKKSLHKPRRAGELEASMLDVTKAKKVFRRSCAYSLQQGLEETCAYYKAMQNIS